MLQTYDPMKVNITYNNRQLRMFGDSMFTLARDEDNVTLKKGVKGDSTYILNANKAGKLTITLQQDSPDVAFLEQCAERNGDGKPRHHGCQRQRFYVLRAKRHGVQAARQGESEGSGRCDHHLPDS